MAGVFLFVVLLIVTFGVLLYFLRPTQTETAVQQHLTNIEANRIGTAEDGTTILMPETLSSLPWLDELIRELPGSNMVSRSNLPEGITVRGRRRRGLTGAAWRTPRVSSPARAPG